MTTCKVVGVIGIFDCVGTLPLAETVLGLNDALDKRGEDRTADCLITQICLSEKNVRC